MKKLLAGLVLIVLLSAACSRNERPSGVLDREKMEAVLWDLIRADLFISNYLQVKDSALDKKDQGIRLYSQVLKMHGITQEQFRRSFYYYRSRPKLLQELMDSVSKRRDDTLGKRPGNRLPVKVDSAL